MDQNDLLQKYTIQEQELAQEYSRKRWELTRKHSAERASLQSLIDNKKVDVERQLSNLERRAKEIELEELQQKQEAMKAKHLAESSMVQNEHDDALFALNNRRENEERRLRKEDKARELEPMVIQNLEAIARLMHLQFGSKGAWLWGKKEDTLSGGHVIRDSPTSWSIEGRISTIRNSWLVYIVNFEETHFEVTIKSNSSYEEYGEGRSYRKYIGRYRNKMQKAKIFKTKDLSENELINSLLEAGKSSEKVCPCWITFVCECPCSTPSRSACACACNACACNACGACGACGAHPSSFYFEMASLWDPRLVEQPSEPLPIEIGRPSAYLRNISNENAVIMYHALLGNLRYAHPGIKDFLSLAEKGTSLLEVASHFPEINTEAEIRTLRHLGFLVVGDEDIQLYNKIAQREQAIGHGEILRCLRLNTASGCNLACTYCHGVNKTESDGSWLMSLETAIKSIRLYTNILLANDQKSMTIRYFGGEPLLNWAVVRDSMKYATDVAREDQLSLTVLLNTNATLLSPELINELATYKQILTVIVSLDGPITVHDSARVHWGGYGSFEQTCKGLDLLQEAGIPLDISVTLGAHNQDHLSELIDLLITRDIYNAGIDPIRIVFEQSDPMILADALIRAIEYGQERGFHVSGMWDDVCERLEYGTTGTYCGGSGSELSVLPTGEIFPCQSQPIRLGTLKDLEAGELFTTDEYRHVAMRIVGNLPNCRGCEIEGMCVGGCAADAYAVEHDLYGRTRYCDFLKKMVHYHLRKLGEIAHEESQA
jgi:radical SAM protein with 4Fe4S-binding SPASM domain